MPESNADELLEQWLASGQELLKARKGSAREQALEDRLGAIEERFAAQPKIERDEALGDLTDAERALILQHRADTLAPPEPDEVEEAEQVEEIEEVAPVAKTRPGRKQGQAYRYTVDDDGNVVPADLPTIYSGPDEDPEVALPVEEAAAA